MPSPSAILVALAADPNRALVVLVYAVVSQQIERKVQVPRVMREAVGISPLPVLLGVLLGSALYGLPGAFLAVPIAGGVQVILAHALRAEAPEQPEEHGNLRGRLAQQFGNQTIAAANS